MKTLAFFFIVLMIVSAGFVLALDAQTIITGGGNSQTTLEYFGNNELFFMGKSSSASPNTPSDRKSTRLNSSHTDISRMPSSA